MSIEELKAERDKRITWWRILRQLKGEYETLEDQLQGQFDMYSFDEFVKHNYGVQILYDQQGNILGSYEVTDKNRHLLFQLKYA